jgi:hypothetical protein
LVDPVTAFDLFVVFTGAAAVAVYVACATHPQKTGVEDDQHNGPGVAR